MTRSRVWRCRPNAYEASPRLVLVVMCVGYFLVLLDVTIVNVALPQMGDALRADVSDLQWVVDGYALALASLMLVGGAVGDLHGHKRLVLVGLAVFGAGSLGCGLAPEVAVLVAARAVQGMGAALLLPGTLAIVSRAFPGSAAQAKAIGVWAGIGSLALPAGPLLGGALVTAFDWRGVFLVNVPIVMLALLVSWVVVPDRDSQLHSTQRGRTLDLTGVGLGVGLLLATTYAFIEAGGDGAGSVPVLMSAAVACLLLCAFVRVEHVRGEGAMLPLSLFGRRGFCVANMAAGTMNACTLGALFVLTLYLQAVQGYSPLLAGLAVVPLFAPLAVIAPAAGRLTGRTGARLPMVIGLTVAAAGLGILGLTRADTAYPVLLPPLLMWGIGLGILTPAVVAGAIADVPSERAGLAAAVNNTARQAGGAIGIAAAGAIAGAPQDAARFLAGMRTVALGGAGLYLVVAVAALVLLSRQPWSMR